MTRRPPTSPGPNLREGSVDVLIVGAEMPDTSDLLGALELVELHAARRTTLIQWPES